MLIQTGPEIWYVDHPLTFAGISVNTRMTVVRLTNGTLWLHSPVPLNDDDKKVLDSLGKVSCVIAPNKLHHLFVKEYKADYYIAPGLEAKRPDINFTEILGDNAFLKWEEDIEQLPIHGQPGLNEFVFFHKLSRTLIVTDLLFNIQNPPSWKSSLYFRLAGIHNRLGISRLVTLTVKNKGKFRESCLKILNWDFDQLIMAHGVVIPTNAKSEVEKVFKRI